ncbi:hypothetical protein [Amycolatopsis vancoresmycina]|nr:hypothetical protein [Amycolatopsis vancoresmycina]
MLAGAVDNPSTIGLHRHQAGKLGVAGETVNGLVAVEGLLAALDERLDGERVADQLRDRMNGIAEDDQLRSQA